MWAIYKLSTADVQVEIFILENLHFFRHNNHKGLTEPSRVVSVESHYNDAILPDLLLLRPSLRFIVQLSFSSLREVS